jgi:hypothetical protein
MQLFPNPTTNQVTISGILQETQIFVYDLNGKLLQEVVCTSNQILDLPYNAGVYYVEAKQQQLSARSKLILIK